MTPDDELRSRIEEATKDLPDDAPPFDGVVKRARVLRARRYLTGGLVAVALAAVVAVPLGLLSNLGAPESPGRGQAVPATSPMPPSVGVVVCAAGGETQVSPPVIRPRADGVHLTVDNRTGRDQELAVVGAVRGTGASERAPTGVSEHTLERVAPGEAEVFCADFDEPPSQPPPGVGLTVVDPEGLWTPTEVQCDGAEISRSSPFMPEPVEGTDPIEVVRARLAEVLQPGDEVRPVGYPESEHLVIAMVRGGQTVATVDLMETDVGWLWLVGGERKCSNLEAPSMVQPGSPDEPQPPDVADVVCDVREGVGTIELLTPTLRPQPDGLHFRIDNRSEVSLWFGTPGLWEMTVPPGITELIEDELPPTGMEVVCGIPPVSEEEANVVFLDVVDPEGVWSPDAEPECGGTMMQIIHDHFFASPGETGDPIDLATRHFAWLLPTDVVKRVGYPDGSHATILVVRGDRVVATAGYASDGLGGWLLGAESLCGDAASHIGPPIGA